MKQNELGLKQINSLIEHTRMLIAREQFKQSRAMDSDEYEESQNEVGILKSELSDLLKKRSKLPKLAVSKKSKSVKSKKRSKPKTAKNEYSIYEKHKYYAAREKDNTLSSKQRDFAKKWIDKHVAKS